jgi:hypothetical protein
MRPNFATGVEHRDEVTCCVFETKVAGLRPGGNSAGVHVLEGHVLRRWAHAFGTVVLRDQDNFVWGDRSGKKRA